MSNPCSLLRFCMLRWRDWDGYLFTFRVIHHIMWFISLNPKPNPNDWLLDMYSKCVSQSQTTIAGALRLPLKDELYSPSFLSSHSALFHARRQENPNESTYLMNRMLFDFCSSLIVIRKTEFQLWCRF